MTGLEMWTEYCTQNNISIDTHHDEWAFCGGGEIGDRLAQLVLLGKKTGTASYYNAYVAENEVPPASDSYSVVLFDNGNAACVIRNYSTTVEPMDEVPAWHGFLEGEGDQSLPYWINVHNELFEAECNEYHLQHAPGNKVVLEKFEVVYPPEYCSSCDFRLIEPTMEYADEILAYRQEFTDIGDSMDGTATLRSVDTVEQWIADSRFYSNPSSTITNGWVPATQLMAVRRSDNRIVGMIHVRHILNDNTKTLVGHVGYSVRPSERRKGYASQMLNAVLPYCAALNIENALITCSKTNEGSRRTILSNGGIYLNSVFNEEEGETIECYHIPLLPRAPIFARAMSDSEAHSVCSWHYPDEYAVYDFPSWSECEMLGWAITSSEKRKNAYYSVILEDMLLAFFHIMNRSDHIELGLGVAPNYCNRHYGLEVVHLAVNTIRKMYPDLPIQLNVRTFNKRAIQCYEKAGFVTIKQFYEDSVIAPGDALLMEYSPR